MAGELALSGQLPNDVENNGLLGLVDHLASVGGDVKMLALVVFDVPKVVTITDTGTQRPIVRLRHIEPIGELLEVSAEWKAALADLKTGRLGDPLPTGDGTTEDGSAVEVYETGPNDDPARGQKLERAKLTVVQP